MCKMYVADPACPALRGAGTAPRRVLREAVLANAPKRAHHRLMATHA
jgi:hypothetical protein